MNVTQALIEDVKKVIAKNKDYQQKVETYLVNNNYRIIDELRKEECLDILAMLVPELYLKIKKNIETYQLKQEMEEAINYIENFLKENKDEYITFIAKRQDEYNAIFLLSKKINLIVSTINNNNPFHEYETKKKATYWANFIVKCQLNENINLVKNDKNLVHLHNSGCPIYNVNNQYRANKVLETFE